MKKKLALIVLALSLGMLAACGVSAGPEVTKVHIGAGPFEDPKFKDCVAPSTKSNSPTNDKYVAYPVSGRDWDMTGAEGADASPITVLSKDNAEMAVPLRVTFDFNTDCKTMQKFYTAYGARYSAYLDEDGHNTKGWEIVLRKVIGDTANTTLDEIAKNYAWKELYSDPAAQNALQDKLSNNLQGLVDVAGKGKYFLNVRVANMQKPYPTDEDLLTNIRQEQTAVTEAHTAEAKARAKKAQAEAETALAKAEALKKKAEIDGYGGFENYNKAQAVKRGLNPYQPTYKVSGTN